MISVIKLLLEALTVVDDSTTTPVIIPSSTISGDDGATNNGRVRKRDVNATMLKAKVHCGTLPIVSFNDTATKGVAAAPIIVAVVAAVIDGEPNTAAAHPTRQPKSINNKNKKHSH
jgi:hypothetical protein